MNHNASSDTGYIVGSVLTTYASTYSELKDRKEELINIKSDLKSLGNQLNTIENTLTEMNSKLDTVVSERKWYKTAAGFVIAASASIIAFIVFLISYSDEISAIKQLLNQLIELNK